MKKMLALGLALVLVISLLPGCNRNVLTIKDGQGKVILRVQDENALYADARVAYWDMVLLEAVQILTQETGCSEEEAKAKLFAGGTIETYFDEQAFQALRSAAATCTAGMVGCAVTDLQGNLVAVYSAGSTGNLATALNAPCSAFKPLSVYAPALEAGVIQWTTKTEDSPYKQLTDSNGNTSDWPANATGSYSYQQVDLYRAVQQSLNTVAVKCLDQLGVEESVKFLQEQLGIPLVSETQRMEAADGQEIIGNIALGYLAEGVSTVDMAGWYQMFANGGSYIQPKTIEKISCDGIDYQRQRESRQIISTATAERMNMLLQGVVEKEGTGYRADCGDIQVAGKTGTNDDNTGNWFVGVTPSYSCAIWHGKSDSNQAAGVFSTAIESIYLQKQGLPKSFPEPTAVKMIICCSESGLEAGSGCGLIERSYIPANETVKKCDQHFNN